jgi:RNA polymerase sigma factor (sigma-70 family)
MDVRAQGVWRKRPEGTGRRSPSGALRRRRGQRTDTDWVGELLGEWHAREIRLAHSFSECRGLSQEQLEELYQETSVALLTRRYQSEEHLLHALRTGIKRRALNLHRDERRHGRILAHSAPGMYAIAEAGAGEQTPELAAIVKQDRLIVAEFLTELSPVEQRVFWLLAEGMGYRSIAPALGLQLNAARSASRSVERKRERFQLLYDTGRLCGFRAATITALQIGQATTEELAERAFAHLDSCAHCRLEHKTNSRRLRRRFQGQAAALLPMPPLVGHLGRLARVDARLRMWLERLMPGGTPTGAGGVREGAVAALAGAGVTAKVAATVATVVVVASGTTAGVVIEQGAHARRAHATRRRAALARQRTVAPAAPSPAPIIRATSSSNVSARIPRARIGHQGSVSTSHRAVSAPGERREPGGFAYLGVPSSGPTAGNAASARMATSTGSTATTTTSSSAPGGTGAERGGGEFSP